MKKSYFIMLMALGLLLVSCRVEDELNSQNSEKATIQYGVSEQSFNSSIFTNSLNQSKIANAKNQASSLSASDLLQRLDLEKAYLSSKDGQEVFHAPVRVFGNYKRSLLSVSKNHSSEVFLLTYPDPTNYRSFYITDLDGHLLKDVKIGDDGKEISQNQTAGKSGDACTQTVYVTCSSGEHSFEWGNAGSCTFWHNLSNGTPPTLFSVNMSCGEPPSGSGSSGPVLEPGGFQGGGTGVSTPPVGGGSPPKNLTPIQCIQGLDCTECNLPGDLDNDCSLNYDEARFQSFFTNLSGTEQQWLSNNATIKNNFFVYLKNNSFSQNSLAFAFFGVDFFVQNPTTTWQQFEYLMYNKTIYETSLGDDDNNTTGGYDTTVYDNFDPLQQNWPTIPSIIPIGSFIGWGYPGIKRNCMDYAKAQIAIKGFQISNYGAPGQTYQIYREQTGVNQSNLIAGLSYLKYALSNNIPVIVGVHDAPGHPGNADQTTDHFIVIVGMGSDNSGKYFTFYDNASGSASLGANPNNKLYYNQATGIISGTSATPYANGLIYILTQIRKSKLK
ncbi:hypothetical protein [uncultured Chryseobacterium sp.]|uniref:hypothetical protein n=1 Tax=uncultured Chryseobacterium sp. TaxID=259322 RepID=UPI0027DC9E34|nr:hypothetical protein [uncultured Chryseobacterium sp.]